MADRHCCPVCGVDYGVLWVFIRASTKFSRIGNRCKKCGNVITLEGRSAHHAKRVVFLVYIATCLPGLFLPPVYAITGGFNYLFVFSALLLLVIFFFFILVYLFIFSILILRLFPKPFQGVGIISSLKSPQKIFSPVSFFTFW
ncbi:MAG: hypothetical protein LBO00_02010 [Zoogloeaceae bacterium]|nr:hypothetical protein [Zoogloeaceae bacterium]